jgi:hypothetical protein
MIAKNSKGARKDVNSANALRKTSQMNSAYTVRLLYLLRTYLTLGSDFDHTMGKIISDNIEPRIVHLPQLAGEINKGLEPDYVAGLQRGRFNQYLGNSLVADQLQNQPTGEHNTIFPFMVAEAKKEDGDDWDYVYAQTVFPVYTMLSLQWRLLSSNAANGHRLEFDPVVWFYAYRGQHWRLYLAYLNESWEATLSSGEDWMVSTPRTPARVRRYTPRSYGDRTNKDL